MTGVVAAGAAAVKRTLFSVVASKAVAVATARGVVSVADGCVALVTTLAAATEVLGEGLAVAALSIEAGFEFDSESTGFDVDCSGSNAGVVGWPDSGKASSSLVSSVDSAPVTAGAVDSPGSVVLVCAPPLLLTMTPDATSADEAVAPGTFVVSVTSAPVEVETVGLAGVDDAPTLEESVCEPSAAAPVLAEEASVDVVDAREVSAPARPGEVTTITPIPRAAANAPTRPM